MIRLRKFPTAKVYSGTSSDNIKHFVENWTHNHVLPRNIRLIGHVALSVKISEVFLRENIFLIENNYLIEAPANNHRPIVLVERTMQIIIRRLDCKKLQNKHYQPV